MSVVGGLYSIYSICSFAAGIAGTTSYPHPQFNDFLVFVFVFVCNLMLWCSTQFFIVNFLKEKKVLWLICKVTIGSH